MGNAYTVKVDDTFRPAIRRYYGDAGLATAKEVAEWFTEYSPDQSYIDDLMKDYHSNGARRRRKRKTGDKS